MKNTARHALPASAWLSLIAVVSLLCVVLCIWLFVTAGARQQRRIIEAINRAGGEARYDFESSKVGPPPPSHFMSMMFGVDFCANVDNIVFPNGTATDSTLQPVGGLRHLKLLYVGDSPISDAGMEHIARLTSLTTLDLSGTRVTDAGMKSLSGLAHLDHLELDRTNITDVGLEQLEGLSGLNSLSVRDTKVTEAGLAQLRCLPRLKRLTVTVRQTGGLDGSQLKRALPKCTIIGIDKKGDWKWWLGED